MLNNSSIILITVEYEHCNIKIWRSKTDINSSFYCANLSIVRSVDEVKINKNNKKCCIKNNIHNRIKIQPCQDNIPLNLEWMSVEHEKNELAINVRYKIWTNFQCLPHFMFGKWQTVGVWVWNAIHIIARGWLLFIGMRIICTTGCTLSWVIYFQTRQTTRITNEMLWRKKKRIHWKKAYDQQKMHKGNELLCCLQCINTLLFNIQPICIRVI